MSHVHADVGQVALTPAGADEDGSGFVWTAVRLHRSASGQPAGQPASCSIQE